mgnify:CR=1 FL=1
MKLTVLGSGSKGNVTFIQLNETKILIDCGLSFRQIDNRIKQKQLDLENLDGVLVTHEHSDHSAGIRGLSKLQQLPVFANRDTIQAVQSKLPQRKCRPCGCRSDSRPSLRI